MGGLRAVLTAVAAVLVVGTLPVTALRPLDLGGRLPVLAGVLAPFAVVPYLLALLLLGVVLVGARRGRRVLLAGAGIAAVGLLVHLWWLAPVFVGGGTGSRTDLTVMTSNLRFGGGDPATVVGAAARRHVDVLVLEEVTPTALPGLRRAGLSDLLPFHVGRPATSAAGTMVFSRWPLGRPGSVPLRNGGLFVDVRAPRPFQVLAVHTAQPVDDPGPWRRDLHEVADRARTLLPQGPTLVVGDFNATRDHAALRRVLAAGLRDAAEEADSGWQPTWPADARFRLAAPVVAIDHVLVSPAFATVRTTAVAVPGTDHRALVADLERR